MILKATTPSNSPWLIPFTTLQFYGKKLDYLHLKNFLHSECELYLKQPLTLPQRKIIAAYHSLNHRLAIEIGRWTVILISRGTRLCHFYCYNTVKMKHISCWRVCPLYNHPIRDTFPSTFENVVPRNLKSGLSFRPTSFTSASFSRMLPHSATLENQSVGKHPDIICFNPITPWECTVKVL